MAGYSGTPLVDKLGIRAGHRLTVIDRPDGFVLEVPATTIVTSRLAAHQDVVLFFTAQRARLSKRMEALGRAVAPAGAIWVAWPKKAAKVPTDMSEDVVRAIALPLGLVDTKVCAIDDTWSGLRLVWRRNRR